MSFRGLWSLQRRHGHPESHHPSSHNDHPIPPICRTSEFFWGLCPTNVRWVPYLILLWCWVQACVPHNDHTCLLQVLERHREVLTRILMLLYTRACPVLKCLAPPPSALSTRCRPLTTRCHPHTRAEHTKYYRYIFILSIFVLKSILWSACQIYISLKFT